MLAAAIPFPDIGPNALTIPLFGQEFAIRWYALAYIAGILIGWRILVALMRRPALWPGDRPPAGAEAMEELFTWSILGIVLGGRLGYVLIYQPAHYLAHPIEIVKVWEGGMSFHGGFLGVVAVAIWFCRKHAAPYLQMADALALSVTPGLFLGRLANFINAELWGRPTDLPWGVIFPGEAAQTCAGIAFGACARHPSQIYEALLEGVILGLVLLVLMRRGALKYPGRVAGTFFAGYGLSRFLVEFLRQADAQYITPDNPLGHVVGGATIGLSMGQILSIPMMVVGLWLVIRSGRQHAPASPIRQ